jgi:hypothetical protein
MDSRSIIAVITDNTKNFMNLVSARRRDLYLTTHNRHMPPVGFEPLIAAGGGRRPTH